MSDRVTQPLPVKLSKEELAARSKELAELIRKQEELEEEKKQQAAEIKAELDRSKARARTLSSSIRTGEEYQDVECEWVPDTLRLRMNLVRRDNGGIVSSRDMNEKERQLEFAGTR
jgi:hypothetical protein